MGVPFPGNFDDFASAMVAQRVDHFSRVARNSKNGFMTLVATSDHFIQFRDPDSVMWAIRRVLKAAAAQPARTVTGRGLRPQHDLNALLC